ncbi:MAG: cytochrome c [Myxococcales bacterium]|nr:cytochrome c [Myxococcales bacterium]
MFESRTIAALVAGAGAALMLALSGCSSDDTTGDAGSTTSGLSQAYQNNCARCHGATGLGSGQFPKIPGSKDEAAFIAFVRAGSPRGTMTAYSASQISDADLKADYLWLTTKR